MLKRICYSAKVVYNGLGTARADGAVVIQQSSNQSSESSNASSKVSSNASREVSSNVTRNVIAIVDAADAREAFAEAEFQDGGFAILPTPADACVDVRGLSLAEVQTHLGSLEPCRVGLVSDNLDVLRQLGQMTLAAVPAPYGVMYWAAATQDVMQLATTLNDLRKAARDWRVGLWLGAPELTPLDARRLSQYLQQTDTPLTLDVRTAADALTYVTSTPLMAARPALRLPVTSDDGDEALSTLVTEIRKADSMVLHCPFEDTLRFPWEAFMAQGVDVALGSGRQGGVLEQLVHQLQTQQQQHASPLALVRAAVKSGHRALGMTPPRFVRGDDASHITFWSG